MTLSATLPRPAGLASELSPVEDDDLPALQTLLDEHVSDDPYQLSAAYYGLTGRNGLWLAAEGANAVLLCRHPNIDNAVLVFPPLGPDGGDLLARMVEEAAASGFAVSLARWPREEEAALPLLPVHRLRRVAEPALDWAFPVQVVDLQRIAAHRGRGFQQLRTELHKLRPEFLEPIDLSPVRHRAAVVAILAHWSNGSLALAEPYVRLLDLFGRLPLAGRLIVYRGVPAGFSIWDESLRRDGVANVHADIALREIAGLPRFAVLDMCEALLRRGFAAACLGGSESAGLDQFKRHLRPVRSVALDTWLVDPA